MTISLIGNPMKEQVITLTISTCFKASKTFRFLKIAFHFSSATCPAAVRWSKLGKGFVRWDTNSSTRPLNVLVFATRVLGFLSFGFTIMVI